MLCSRPCVGIPLSTPFLAHEMDLRGRCGVMPRQDPPVSLGVLAFAKPGSGFGPLQSKPAMPGRGGRYGSVARELEN